VVKLFLKKPSNNQSLVQKVLQMATAENDNPDIRDRAYVYWRLLSGDLDVAKAGSLLSPKARAPSPLRLLTSHQNIVLSQKPPIATTMTSLPPALLEQLLTELSTLASVYHKPRESFVGKGRFGADEIQRAAIQEQRQDAAENPIAASVAAAAAANGTGDQNANAENLLDIDFDGAAPASADAGQAAAGGGAAADMMTLFDAASAPAAAAGQNGFGAADLMGGFADMDLSGTSAPPPPGVQLQPAEAKPAGGGGTDDLLGLF